MNYEGVHDMENSTRSFSCEPAPATTSTPRSLFEKRHDWELLGFGPAPYRLLAVLECPDVVDLNNVPEDLRTANALGVGLGSCQVCGHGIRECYVLESADGTRFVVGCDCVLKRDDECRLRDDVTRERNRIRTEKRHAREDARIAAARDRLPAVRDVLAGKPHPNQWRAEKGSTLADWADWMLAHAGRTGRLHVARVVERH